MFSILTAHSWHYCASSTFYHENAQFPWSLTCWGSYNCPPAPPGCWGFNNQHAGQVTGRSYIPTQLTAKHYSQADPCRSVFWLFEGTLNPKAFLYLFILNKLNKRSLLCWLAVTSGLILSTLSKATGQKWNWTTPSVTWWLGYDRKTWNGKLGFFFTQTIIHFSFLWAVLLLELDPKGLRPDKGAVRKGKMWEENNVWGSLTSPLDLQPKETRKNRNNWIGRKLWNTK